MPNVIAEMSDLNTQPDPPSSSNGPNVNGRVHRHDYDFHHANAIPLHWMIPLGLILLLTQSR